MRRNLSVLLGLAQSVGLLPALAGAATPFGNLNGLPDGHNAAGGVVGSTVVATNYGGSVSSPNSLWFGAATNRFAASRSLNTTQGGVVDFWLRIASGTSSTWETADLPADGIVLEYSINGGAWWTEISRYTNSIYTSWTHLTVDIPVAAQTVNTQFRWRQLSNSGTGYGFAASSSPSGKLIAISYRRQTTTASIPTIEDSIFAVPYWSGSYNREIIGIVRIVID